MSIKNTQSEFGLIKFDMPVLRPLIGKMVAFYNSRQDMLYYTAMNLYLNLKESAVDMDNQEAVDYLMDFFQKEEGDALCLCTLNGVNLTDCESQKVANTLINIVFLDQTNEADLFELRMPLVEDFSKKVVSFETELDLSKHAYFEMGGENCIIHIAVSDKDKDAKETKANPYYRFLMLQLSKIEWDSEQSDFGGAIYARDKNGNAYIKQIFGPYGEKLLKEETEK